MNRLTKYRKVLVDIWQLLYFLLNTPLNLYCNTRLSNAHTVQILPSSGRYVPTFISYIFCISDHVHKPHDGHSLSAKTFVPYARRHKLIFKLSLITSFLNSPVTAGVKSSKRHRYFPKVLFYWWTDYISVVKQKTSKVSSKTSTSSTSKTQTRGSAMRP